jgi:MFS-type transporter involved in bile tolerance (Atg22 family)
MSIVLFLALPMSVLVVVDYMKLKSEMQYEIRQLKKLKKELKEAHEKSNTVKPTDDSGGL